jgi:hypothetical protein
LHVVADLGVADKLDENPRTAGELAVLTGAHAEALARVMRLLSAHGVFEACEGKFRHSPASRMLRTDAAARAQFYRSMFDMGALSPNDIRAYENQNPIEGGDVYLVQMNLQTLDATARVDAPAQRDYPAAQNDQERRHCHVLAQQLDVVDKQIHTLGKLKLPDESAASAHPSYHRAGRSLEVARDELRVFGVSSESRVAVELQNATDHVHRLADAVGVTEAPLLLGARRKLLQQAMRDPAQESSHAEAKTRAERLRGLPLHLRLKVYKQESVEQALARG